MEDPVIRHARFLELSVPAPDIRASLDFYRQLGFAELPVNDIRPWYYAVVTDGRIAIGLHGGGLELPSLSFVLPDVARCARRLADQGMELAFSRLADDQFNEAGLESPDGQLVVMMEARTFSPGLPEDAPRALPGQATGLLVRARNPAASRHFWALLDLTGTDTDDAALTLSGSALPADLALTLSPDLPVSGPVLRYGLDAVGRETLVAALRARELAFRNVGHQLVITAPEGTRLLVGDP